MRRKPRVSKVERHLETSGNIARLTTKGLPAVGGGVRGQIVAWSAASRARFARTVLAVDWSAYGGHLAFITLTYPGRAAEAFQCQNGRTLKAHMRAFCERWRRRYGRVLGAWKVEFQRRGQPHLHIAMVVPEGRTIEEVRDFVRVSWWEVVGSGDIQHFAAGTQTDWCLKSPVAYWLKNGVVDKVHQNLVPNAFQDVGRIWGLWGVKPSWQVSQVTPKEFARLRRILARLKRGKVRRRAFDRQAVGVWAATRVDAVAIDRLLDRMRAGELW